MVIGLLALIPVLGIAGGLLMAVGVDGEAGAWVTFGIAAAWIVLMIWWALRAPAPAHLSDEARGRYLAFLRHAQYQPLDPADDDTTRDHS